VDEQIFEDIRWHLFQDLLQQQERESRLGEFMNNKDERYLRDFSAVWGPQDIEYGGVRDYTDANYAQDCIDLAKKNTGHDLLLQSCPKISYTEGNSMFSIGAEMLPTSAIPAIIQFLRSLPLSVSNPPLTDAVGANAVAQAPTAVCQKIELFIAACFLQLAQSHSG
jgi:hypothetical protein